MNEEGRRRHFGDGTKSELGDKALKGAGTGAGIGAVAGGTLAAALTGAGAGAITGGAIGALVNMGIPKDRAAEYESGLNRGGILFGVRPRAEDRSVFEREWAAEGAEVRRR